MLDNEIAAVFATAVASYLLGSLPFAVFVARTAGVDIFQIGTGNPGASNIYRKISRRHGAAVFALDIAKGVGAVFIGVAFGCPEELLPFAAAFAIVGHWLPVFMRFKGGAGLATGVGIGVALLGGWGLIAAAAGIAVLPFIKDGPRAAAVTLAVAVAAAFLTGPNWVVLGGMALILVMLVGRLLLVEFPRDRRGDRPEPHIRN